MVIMETQVAKLGQFTVRNTAICVDLRGQTLILKDIPSGRSVVLHLGEVLSSIWEKCCPPSGRSVVLHLGGVLSSIWEECCPPSGRSVVLHLGGVLSIIFAFNIEPAQVSKRGRRIKLQRCKLLRCTLF